MLELMQWMFIHYIFLWAAGVIAAPLIAASKGYNPGWFVLAALLIGPFSVVVTMVMPYHPTGQQTLYVLNGQMRTCPACAEPVRLSARRCRYCTSELESLSPAGPAPWAHALPKPISQKQKILIGVACAVAVIGIFLFDLFINRGWRIPWLF